MTRIISQNELEFLTALTTIQPLSISEEYRAYYDESGKVIFLAANKFPKSGNWITISKETYVKQCYDWLFVIDGKLVEKLPKTMHFFELEKSDKGFRVVKNHAGIVLSSDEEYKEIEYYDSRNS